MKTISIAEFKSLLERKDWQREQDYEILERGIRQIEEWDDENSLKRIDISYAWGWASKISMLDGIKITYTEYFQYDEYEPDSLAAGESIGLDDEWVVEGVVVVDDDGDPLEVYELADYLPAEFSDIDYSVLDIAEVHDIDVDEASDMDTITLPIDYAPDIRFTGQLIATAASSDNQEYANYSGQHGRWAELALYKTIGGKFVCHKIASTRWSG
jgi:hypothetical protein